METEQRWVPDTKPKAHNDKGCIFCSSREMTIVQEKTLLYAVYDQFPVTPLHTLIIPKRHVSDYFQLNQKEIIELNSLLQSMKSKIQTQDSTVTGFNIGMNCGEDAGQTVMHCHTHLIPRRKGDMDNPRGGVRGVIPDKQAY